jgi:hypothetical protein
MMGSSSAASTPDFNTDVNVHAHSISLKEQRSARAKSLKDIKSRSGGSLIPESLKHIEEDEEHAFTAENLRKLGQVCLTILLSISALPCRSIDLIPQRRKKEHGC